MTMLKTALDRVTHPILGPLTISQAVLHWPIWLMVFSGSSDFESRIEAIREYGSSDAFLSTTLLGLGFGLGYVYLLQPLLEIPLAIAHEVDVFKLKRTLRRKYRLESEEKYSANVYEVMGRLRRELGTTTRICSSWLEASRKIPFRNLYDREVASALLELQKATPAIVQANTRTERELSSFPGASENDDTFTFLKKIETGRIKGGLASLWTEVKSRFSKRSAKDKGEEPKS